LLNTDSYGNWIRQLVLPQSDNQPAALSQYCRIQMVTKSIPRQFRMPVTTVRIGRSAMPRATVPKATVRKNRDSQLWKNEIGATGYRMMAPPSGYPVLSEDLR
jgi:hypothetical protein